MYRRILVTLDGSEHSEVVLPYAKVLANKLDIDISLIHVCRQGEHALIPLHRAYIEHKAEIITQQIKKTGKKGVAGTNKRKLEIRSELLFGNSAEEILRYSEENSFDLILMATHGYSGMKRWSMGSVTEKVINATRVPVWLVPVHCRKMAASDAWPDGPILVPLDGSELAESVLSHVESLAGQGGIGPVEVVILRVLESPVMSDHYFRNIPETRDQVEEYLSRIEKRLKKSHLEVKSKVITGEPADEIIDYVESGRFSLIVMSTHARSGLSRWVMGSVAMKVVSGVCCPILLVHPQ